MTFDLDRLIVHAGGRPHAPRFDREDIIAFQNLTGHRLLKEAGTATTGEPFPPLLVPALLWVMCGGLDQTGMTLDQWEDDMTPTDTHAASRLIERVAERDQLDVLRAAGKYPRRKQ